MADLTSVLCFDDRYHLTYEHGLIVVVLLMIVRSVVDGVGGVNRRLLLSLQSVVVAAVAAVVAVVGMLLRVVPRMLFEFEFEGWLMHLVHLVVY